MASRFVASFRTDLWVKTNAIFFFLEFIYIDEKHVFKVNLKPMASKMHNKQLRLMVTSDGLLADIFNIFQGTTLKKLLYILQYVCKVYSKFQ